MCSPLRHAWDTDTGMETNLLRLVAHSCVFSSQTRFNCLCVVCGDNAANHVHMYVIRLIK